MTKAWGTNRKPWYAGSGKGNERKTLCALFRDRD